MAVYLSRFAGGNGSQFLAMVGSYSRVFTVVALFTFCVCQIKSFAFRTIVIYLFYLFGRFLVVFCSCGYCCCCRCRCCCCFSRNFMMALPHTRFLFFINFFYYLFVCLRQEMLKSNGSLNKKQTVLH